MGFKEMLLFKFNLVLADLSIGLIFVLTLIIGYGLMLIYIGIKDAYKLMIKKIKQNKKEN